MSTMTVTMGLYFFAIAFALAHLEIQIEGKHGWAAQLPTWRWQSDAVLRWAGKPVTGYHVFLQLFLLLLIHLPLMYTGFTLEREAELISLFFLLAVFWDFLWFVCNPHFGLSRFGPGQVWWFKSWFLGLPTPYYAGLGLSLLVYLMGGFAFERTEPLWERAISWALVFAALAVPTLLTVGATAVAPWRRAAADVESDARH
jgi:hypothetical protein